MIVSNAIFACFAGTEKPSVVVARTMFVLEWLPTIIGISLGIGAVVVISRVLELEWLPKCPKCDSRGYREVCALSSIVGEAALHASDDEMEWRSIRRCKQCHVYRIQLPSGWVDLPWDNWQAAASRIMRNSDTAD